MPCTMSQLNAGASAAWYAGEEEGLKGNKGRRGDGRTEHEARSFPKFTAYLVPYV